MGKRKKKKPIRVVKRKTPSRETMRILIFNKPVFGKNHHQFRGKMTDHLHFGENLKLVYRPKELRGLYIKSQKGEKYVRLQDYLRQKARKLARANKKRAKKHRRKVRD